MTAYIDPRSKLLKHMDRLAEIQRGGKPAPVNVEIDLTNRCNLGCDLCHFGHVHSRGPLAHRRTHTTGDQMDTQLIMSILQQLHEDGARSVTWTGGGEPTLHPDFEDIIANCRMPQGIYTNGTMIGSGRAQLMRERLDWVYVSLDRANRESYRQYKQVDAFNKACDGVRNLTSLSGKATIGVGFLLDETNFREGESMIDLALNQLGAHYVQFRPAVQFSPNDPGKTTGETWWLYEAIRWLDDVKFRPGVIADVDRFAMMQNWSGHGYKTCHWSQMQTIITPDGRVWTCVNRRGFDGDCLGDLKRESFQEIWARSSAYTVNEKCRVLCRGHIPNLALSEILRDVPHKEFI